jgi:hypothetical protein
LRAGQVTKCSTNPLVCVLRVSMYTGDPKIHQRVGEQMSTEFFPARGELRDLAAVPAGQCLQTPSGNSSPCCWSRLWKFHDSEGLDPGASVLSGIQLLRECLSAFRTFLTIHLLCDGIFSFPSLSQETGAGLGIVC